MSQDMHDLTARLERLERENRRVKRVAFSLAGLGLLLGLAGAAAPALCDVVMAERLVLRDPTGHQRIVADAYTGSPTLTLYAENGRTLARLGADKLGGASLVLFDEKGAPKIPATAPETQPETRPEVKKDQPLTMLR